jgi:xylan 1,4-beta-xylosidase
MRNVLLAFCLLQAAASASPVIVRVDAASSFAADKSSWAYFGYDEANYTYAPNGRKLIRELVELSRDPVHIRTHFLLASGDGSGALKWGSTNAYSEDASGKPMYDWTVVDKILDTLVDAGAIPFVEIGFMPRALSTHPDPYATTWIPGAKNAEYFGGWTYPPMDYQKWSELIEAWVRHALSKYGEKEVSKWDWEVWNEPDIGYWHGTPEEYDALYDYTSAAVKRALPSAHVGGPASTGPGAARAAEFLRQFLAHCSSGRNNATRGQGAALDFISYHAKGRPQVTADHVQMGLAQEMKDVERGFEIVKSFPKFAQLPIILSEADPEGCAACSARVYPQNAYRNGTLYAAYEPAAWKTITDLAKREQVNLQGMLTWAFEFENQPYFDGFRTLATNGIDKPVLNFFRMAGLLNGRFTTAESSGAVPSAKILARGAESPVVDAVAVRSQKRLAVLVWHYGDAEASKPEANIALRVAGLPASLTRTRLEHFRIDQEHSNAYTAWKRMGSPQSPSSDQYRELERAGQLQLLGSPSWAGVSSGAIELKFSLPYEALSLIEFSWD